MGYFAPSWEEVLAAIGEALKQMLLDNIAFLAAFVACLMATAALAGLARRSNWTSVQIRLGCQSDIHNETPLWELEVVLHLVGAVSILSAWMVAHLLGMA